MYRWVNLVSLLFGGRGTVEFRIHNPTTDVNKAINWLYICNAILLYAEKYYEEIIDTPLTNVVSLRHIISRVYPREVSNYLIKYLSWKAKKHKEEYEKKGDDTGSYMLTEELKGNFIDGMV